MRFSSSRRFGTALGAAFILAACAEPGPTQIEEKVELSSASSGPVLVECPTDVTRSVTRSIGSLGGSIELDGHRLNVPLGALLLPVEFTMTAPASRFVEVHITANGEHGFEFLETAGITISYARCTRNNISGGGLVAYKVDPTTKALLKHMGGSNDTGLRSVTFATDSLSAYAIAQ